MFLLLALRRAIMPSLAKASRENGSTTSQGQPLHVPPLGSAQGHHALLGKGVQGEWVHHKPGPASPCSSSWLCAGPSCPPWQRRPGRMGPPQARASLSMFLLLALRRAIMPSLAKASRENGSTPFWLMTTKVFPFSLVQTFFFSSIIF